MHQFLNKLRIPASFEKYFIRTNFVLRHSTRTSECNDYFLLHFFYISFTQFYKVFWIKSMKFEPVQCQNLLKSLFRNTICI